MQFLLDFIDIPVPAVSVVPRVYLSFEFHLASDSIDDLFLLVRSVQLSNLPRCQQVVYVHEESLVSDLSFCEQEQYLIFLDPCFLVQCLQISLEVINAVSRADCYLECIHIHHRSTKTR